MRIIRGKVREEVSFCPFCKTKFLLQLKEGMWFPQVTRHPARRGTGHLVHSDQGEGGRWGSLNKVSQPSMSLLLGGENGVCVWCGVCVCAFLGYFSVHLPSSKSCLSPLGLSHSRTETLSGCLSRHLALQGAGMIHRGMKPSEITAWSPRPLAASILVLVVIEEGRRHSPCLCQASPTFSLPQPGHPCS